MVLVWLLAGPAGPGSAAARSPLRAHPAGRLNTNEHYQAPITPLVVLHPFDPPVKRYGAGTVGVDLTAGSGAVVVAAGAGTVAFAGSVAGRGVVVISHPDGIRTEYEPLRPSVVVGQLVAVGTRIGVIGGHHVGCTATCLHWGARRDQTYFDPLSLLHPLGLVRLLPRSG